MLALKEGIVPPLMDTNALAIEAWPPLTSILKESKELEFDDSMETMLVVHRSENGSIICLYESTSKTASSSRDTMENTFVALPVSSEAQVEAYEDKKDGCNSFEHLNEIAFDGEHQIQSITNELENMPSAVQFEEDTNSILCAHETELAMETKAEIDTATPFEYVKKAMNMFGGKDD